MQLQGTSTWSRWRSRSTSSCGLIPCEASSTPFAGFRADRAAILSRTLAIAVVALASSSAQSPTPSARIVGSVADEAGAPAANAYVHVSSAPIDGVAGQYVNSTRTKADGSFDFPQVPTGKLRVCVTPAGNDLIGTCGWLPALLVETKNGETLRMPQTRLPAGHRLKVRLNDARGLVETNDRARGQRAVSIGAFAPYAAYLPMPVARKTSTEREWEVLIPYDTDIQLLLNAAGYVVSAGALGVANRAQSVKIPVRVDKGKPASDVVLTVTGVE